MDKLKTTGIGGFPLVLDDIRQFLGRLSGSQGIYQAFNNLLRGFGDNFIVQGVVASGTTPNVAITEGWVLLGGELLKVDAQTGINTSTDNKFKKVTTFDSRGNKTFQNATVEDTYEKNRAVVQGTSGNLAFNAARFEDIRIIREFTETLVNSTFGTTELVLHLLTPSVTKSSAKMQFTFQATLHSLISDPEIICNMRLKVGGVIKKLTKITVRHADTSANFTNVVLIWIGPYTANQDVLLTGQTESSSVNVTSSILICESLDSTI